MTFFEYIKVTLILFWMPILVAVLLIIFSIME